VTDELLEEQIRYYRERAPEYDVTSTPDGDPFAALTAVAIEELRGIGPVDRAVELGAGTGQWTGHVASVARHVIAVDSSPEVLALNAEKVRSPNVEHVVADLFTWRPSEPVDLIVFTAVLSHIPHERFEAFWSGVRDMLVPGGRVFVFDESAHGLWQEESTVAPEVVYRTLQDGRRFRIVKVLWVPAQLRDRLARLGWDANLVHRDPFYWGTIVRTRRG
jgi:demethylmenaquinone methyltransferase/2-methoxy-6-polyprenyl-1,4-benzoquinol methylase